MTASPSTYPIPDRATRGRAAARPRSRRRARAHARGGIGWIVLCGVLLAGVVFVNVAVLRLNLSLDKANSDRAKLQAQTAALQSQLSSALASPRIEQRARVEDGLVEADPSTIGYVNLGR
jgi:hypothetical protein